jgi:hypothetical protein
MHTSHPRLLHGVAIDQLSIDLKLTIMAPIFRTILLFVTGEWVIITLTALEIALAIVFGVATTKPLPSDLA